MTSNKFSIEERPLKVHEYLDLRKTTAWIPISRDRAAKALTNDLYSVCITRDDKTIGIARIIGDGAIYFYLQDLIVLPEYQNQDIGRLLMKRIEKYLKKEIPNNSFIDLMAANNTESFYRRFGYKSRTENNPGMFKYLD